MDALGCGAACPSGPIGSLPAELRKYKLQPLLYVSFAGSELFGEGQVRKMRDGQVQALALHSALAMNNVSIHNATNSIQSHALRI